MSVAWASLAGNSQPMSRPSKPRLARRETEVLANVARPAGVDTAEAKDGEYE